MMTYIVSYLANDEDEEDILQFNDDNEIQNKKDSLYDIDVQDVKGSVYSNIGPMHTQTVKLQNSDLISEITDDTTELERMDDLLRLRSEVNNKVKSSFI